MELKEFFETYPINLKAFATRIGYKRETLRGIVNETIVFKPETLSKHKQAIQDGINAIGKEMSNIKVK